MCQVTEWCMRSVDVLRSPLLRLVYCEQSFPRRWRKEVTSSEPSEGGFSQHCAPKLDREKTLNIYFQGTDSLNLCLAILHFHCLSFFPSSPFSVTASKCPHSPFLLSSFPLSWPLISCSVLSILTLDWCALLHGCLPLKNWQLTLSGTDILFHYTLPNLRLFLPIHRMKKMTGKFLMCWLFLDSFAPWPQTVPNLHYFTQRFEWRPTHDSSLQVLWHMICHYQWTLFEKYGSPSQFVPDFTNRNLYAECEQVVLLNIIHLWLFVPHSFNTLELNLVGIFYIKNLRLKIDHNTFAVTCLWVCSTLCPHPWVKLPPEKQIPRGQRRFCWPHQKKMPW